MRRLLLVTFFTATLANAEPLFTARVGLGVPELLSGAFTLHAIPYFDVDAGGGGFGVGNGFWARGGPRYLLEDWRDDEGNGPTIRVSALFGFGWVRAFDALVRGFDFAGALDLSFWSSKHAITLQLVGGGTFDPTRTTRRVLPDLRLSIGFTL